jgi:hypothetical protein
MRVGRFALAGLLIALAGWVCLPSCSLDPQPEIPGADTAAQPPAGTGGTSGTGTGGSNKDDNAGGPARGGEDAATTYPPNVAPNSVDAGRDGASDAEKDGQPDGASDAETDGRADGARPDTGDNAHRDGGRPGDNAQPDSARPNGGDNAHTDAARHAAEDDAPDDDAQPDARNRAEPTE